MLSSNNNTTTSAIQPAGQTEVPDIEMVDMAQVLIATAINTSLQPTSQSWNQDEVDRYMSIDAYQFMTWFENLPAALSIVPVDDESSDSEMEEEEDEEDEEDEDDEEDEEEKVEEEEEEDDHQTLEDIILTIGNIWTPQMIHVGSQMQMQFIAKATCVICLLRLPKVPTTASSSALH
uniref:Uncharacterized protein n=1 Tax=Moniliophthora roreri TaxID=221103 RepID=A0A0W0FER7_MONRR